jgi:hypothetical protein
VRSEDPREGLQRAFDDFQPEIDEEDAGAYAELRKRTDETLVVGVNEGFELAFLLGGGLALLAALLLRPALPAAVATAALAAAIALPAAFALAADGSRPPPVELADPCRPRDLPDTEGLGGLAQDVALTALDRAACDAGSSREELVLALVDEEEAERYRERYDLDPRTVGDLFGAVLGGGD